MNPSSTTITTTDVLTSVEVETVVKLILDEQSLTAKAEIAGIFKGAFVRSEEQFISQHQGPVYPGGFQQFIWPSLLVGALVQVGQQLLSSKSKSTITKYVEFVKFIQALQF
jgi:hypothetical protein